MDAISHANKDLKYLKATAIIFLMVYLLIYVVSGRLLTGVSAELSIILMIAALLPFIMIVNEMTGQGINRFALFLSGAILILGKIFYAIILDPVATLDATRYYAQVPQYINDFDSFIDFFSINFEMNHVLMSAYPAFGIAYLPFYILFNTESPLLIVVFNSVSLILIAYFSLLITKKHFWQEVNDKTWFGTFIVMGVLISPTLMYWSSTFSKDIFSVLIAIIALYFLLNKKYIFFILFLAYATMLRPYSIAIIGIYYVFYKGSKKLTWLGVIISLGVVSYYIGTTGLINTINTMAYLIAAPNPFSIENWDAFFLLEVEILFILIGLVLSLYVFINNKQSRKFYLLALGSLLIYSCVMTLVGFGVIDARGNEYGIGVVGDAMSRKKLPLIVLYYTVISYTLINIKKVDTV